MERDDPYVRINAQAFLTTFDALLARPDCDAEKRQNLLQAKAAFQVSFISRQATVCVQAGMRAFASLVPAWIHLNHKYL